MPRTPSFPDLIRNPSHFISFGFGAGLAPRAPGTAGSLVGLPVWFVLSSLPAIAYGLAAAALFFLGVWVTARTERDLGVHDHPGIVWDEIVGMLVTLAFVPLDVRWLAAGFVLFRIFDIWKPFPIRWLNNRVAGGWGIMLDDLAAGIAAALCLQGLIAFYGR
ncbi:MAG: phosphatidylglycerophosphatase A [Gammaproteobacteria bacterium]|nr:phosphatidylglycerophosphatase A [Gammaproteobacteria bacterium]